MGALQILNACKLGAYLKWTLLCCKESVRNFLNPCIFFQRVMDCLTPIDYVRYREFEFVFSSIAKYRPLPYSVLDIASPKLLALMIAHSIPTSKVYSIDILDSEVKATRLAAKMLNITNLTAEVQDARALPYTDNTFDLAMSVSVFEHIAPEKDGEIAAIKELSRVIAPGGIAILTVPFSKCTFSEYRVGSVYERVSHQGEAIFFQRFYNFRLLINNIVIPSKMKLIYLGFIEERYFSKSPHRRLAHYINSSQKQNIIFGPFFFLLSRLFLSPPKSLQKCAKPYIACIVLKKM